LFNRGDFTRSTNLGLYRLFFPPTALLAGKIEKIGYIVHFFEKKICIFEKNVVTLYAIMG